MALALACTTATTMLQAQNDQARQVLDATAALFNNAKGIKAHFKADSFTGGKMEGSTQGQMCVQGEKFQMTSPQAITWYNGTTQWSYIKSNEEVNITTPTAEEKAAMNPYAIVSLYKKGYNYKMTSTTLRGKSCYEVTLTAKNRKQSPRTIIINIDKSNHAPMCIRLKQNEKDHWTRIAIDRFQTGQHFSESDFTFKAQDYPQAEVIDLR